MRGFLLAELSVRVIAYVAYIDASLSCTTLDDSRNVRFFLFLFGFGSIFKKKLGFGSGIVHCLKKTGPLGPTINMT